MASYTTLAQRYTAKFPMITYVGTQVNFWILADVLLVSILRLYTHFVARTFEVPIVVGKFTTMLSVAIILGLIYGVGIGITEYYLDKKIFRKLSLGKVLLFKTFISISLFALLLLIFRFVLFDFFVAPVLAPAGVRLTETSWDYLFFLLLIYFFCMTLVITFINQVNRKYGPGVLVPLLLGRYRSPKEEERIFMFMDLKSSTSAAETLGHLKYSSFIRDCFSDINEMLYPFSAQVYQYVGDEIVLMWPSSEGLREHFCIRFFFEVRKQFESRADHYISNYGFIPQFKAGLHMGKVTAVEIGEIKKDIAYHGDTLNTAARIQSVCNDHGSDLLASEHLIEQIGVHERFAYNHFGKILLKGKLEEVGIVAVNQMNIEAPASFK
jgi:adenylate cyclase